MADNMTPAQRSRTMSRIRNKDTAPEMAIRRILFRRGLRYRVHYNRLPGRPDIAFTRAKIAVFVDGDFWHGRTYHVTAAKLSPYWQKKISGNIARDVRTTLELERMGWHVVRLWEKDIQ